MMGTCIVWEGVDIIPEIIIVIINIENIGATEAIVFSIPPSVATE
jgi:hypothetical protein